MANTDMYSDSWTPGELLAGDGNGQELAAMKNTLLASRNKYKAVLDKGVSPDEFKKGEVLLAAYDAAIRGLETAWAIRHGKA